MSNLISNVPASMCLPPCRNGSAPTCILGALSVHLRYGLHTPALRLTIAVTDNRPKARFYIKLAPTSYRRDSHPLTQHALAWRTLAAPARPAVQAYGCLRVKPRRCGSAPRAVQARLA